MHERPRPTATRQSPIARHEPAARRRQPRTRRSQSLLPFLLAAVVPLLLYARTVTFEFVQADDADLIAGNDAFLSDLRNVPRAFTRSYFEVEGEPSAQKTYYRPVAIVSFMIDTAAAGAGPRSHHAANVVLHAAVTCLLLALALAWGARRDAALAMALVFAVHPVNAQAVAWIAGRNDLLMAAFGLISLLAWTATAEAVALRNVPAGDAWAASARRGGDAPVRDARATSGRSGGDVPVRDARATSARRGGDAPVRDARATSGRSGGDVPVRDARATSGRSGGDVPVRDARATSARRGGDVPVRDARAAAAPIGSAMPSGLAAPRGPATSRATRSATASAVAIHTIAFAFALFSKETGLMFPLLAVLHQRVVLRQRLARAQWIALGGDALVVAAWATLRARALAGMPSALSRDTLTVVASNAPQVLAHLRKMLIPIDLNVAPGVQDRDLLLAALALVVIGIVATRCLTRAVRLLAVAWAVLFLAPTLAVPGLPAYEHRAYLPLLGILLCLSLATSAAGARAGTPVPARRTQRYIVGGFAAAVLVLAVLTYERLDVFRDPFAYWTDAARDPTFGPLAHVNLGQLHERAGRTGDARREYLAALARDPNTPKAHNNLGVVLMSLDEPDLAMTHFKEETARHPWNADGWFNLALWMEMRGRPADARRYYERALAADPAYTPAYEKLRALPAR